MHRSLIAFAAVLALGLAACSGGGDAKPAAMGDCCKKSAEIQAQVPKCCASAVDKAAPVSDCCKASKMDPSKKADCCKKTEDILAKMPDCCKQAAAGNPPACCKK